MLKPIVKKCFKALRSFWLKSFNHSDDPYKNIEPEYLITMEVANTFSKKILEKSELSKVPVILSLNVLSVNRGFVAQIG